jgi:hypothetical protein
MFFIYVNKKTATLHRGGCEDCNFGDGKANGKDKSGRWLGPTELLEKAKPPDGIKLKPCKKCCPDKDW